VSSAVLPDGRILAIENTASDPDQERSEGGHAVPGFDSKTKQPFREGHDGHPGRSQFRGRNNYIYVWYTKANGGNGTISSAVSR